MPRLPDSEVLGLLNCESFILAVAREITSILRESSLADAAIVGGIAVYLHGHRRAAIDLDLRVADSRRLADELAQHGFEFDAERRESGSPACLFIS
jgi:hypothetical protein